MNLSFFIILILMVVVAFFQNMAFTAVSRSRNAGDPSYHRKCAWGSNGIWIICQMFIWSQIMPVLIASPSTWTPEAIIKIIVTLGAYTLATTEGSVLMMKILLKKEKGNRRVGANPGDINIKKEGK